MSTPKRYIAVGQVGIVTAKDHGMRAELNIVEDANGGWISWDDYAALAAENERLREAGDAMYHTAQQDGTGLWLHKSFQDWNASKEGRDAK